jgi:hypothetical protein
MNSRRTSIRVNNFAMNRTISSPVDAVSAALPARPASPGQRLVGAPGPADPVDSVGGQDHHGLK